MKWPQIVLFCSVFLTSSAAILHGQGDIRGKSTEEWIELLSHEAAEIRVAAAKALGQLGGTLEENKIAPLLTTALGTDKETAVREAIIVALGKMGAAAAPAVKDLVALMRDKDLAYRAVQSLGQLGPEARGAVDSLIDVLGDDHLGEVAASALGRIGTDAIGALTKAAQSAAGKSRARAYSALGEVGAQTKDWTSGESPIDAVVPVLTRGLEDKDKDIRYRAVVALGRIGAKAKPALPALLEALEDKDKVVARQASQALGAIGSEVVEDLVKALASESGASKPQVRVGVVRALGAMRGEAIETAAAGLAKVLKDDDNKDVRYQAALSLKKLGAKAGIAAAALAAALRDKDVFVRRQSEQALFEMGSQAAAALAPELKDAALRAKALGILGRLGKDAKPAASAVSDLLAGGDETTRLSAIDILTKIGPDAKDAIPGLEKLQKEGTAKVREAAEKALAVVKVEEKEESK